MDSITEYVEQFSKSNEESYKARHTLERACLAACDPAKAAERAALARQLTEALHAFVPGDKPEDPPKNKYDARTRIVLLRLLAYVGDEPEVERIYKAISSDIALREEARRALETNRSPSATAALIRALDEETGVEFSIGVIHSLAVRGGDDALAAIRKQARQATGEIRWAAIDALGQFPDPGNDAFLAKAMAQGSARNRDRARKARVRLAECLLASGNKAAAKSIYQALMKEEGPARKAAEIALKGTQ